MEYLHRRKEAPMQGLSGLWGGVGSNLTGGTPDPASGTTGYPLPISGGNSWFSYGHYGYEDQPSYQFPADRTVKNLYGQRTQNGAYQWWFIVWQMNGSNNFTLRYGARIAVPGGTGTGQYGPYDLSTFTTTGNATTPSSGSFCMGWNSGVSGDQQTGPPHYVDATDGGTIGYHPHPSPNPSNGEQVTFNSNETGTNFHCHVTWDDS